MEGEQGEAIMICIDTSSWIMADEFRMFKEQADAIELYCKKKFQSHKDTVVGICGMGDRCVFHLAEPCNILSLIMKSVNGAVMGGHLRLIASVVKAHTVWFGCWNKELGNHLPKRIAVFAGGRVSESMADAQELGKAMKNRNVAFDAISFGDPAKNKQQLFKTMIDAADNNRNCNLVLVPPGSTVCDALSSSQIIQDGSAPFATLPVQPEISVENIDRSQASLSVQQQKQKSSKQNINALSRFQSMRSGSAPLRSLSEQQGSSRQNMSLSRSPVIPQPHVGGRGPLASSVHQKSSKRDKKAAASDPESIDPHGHPTKVNALSQSVVDLRLENVEPEILDEMIERARRELESLIRLKDKQVAC